MAKTWGLQRGVKNRLFYNN